jgi:hypothetical protein
MLQKLDLLLQIKSSSQQFLKFSQHDVKTMENGNARGNFGGVD